MADFGSKKRNREYEELKGKFEESGRYKGREEEVAARIVNKQRAQYGETKGEKKKDREGKSPDRDLPIRDYQQLTVPQIKDKLEGCSQKQLKQIKKYEEQHKHRKTLLAELNERV